MQVYDSKWLSWIFWCRALANWNLVDCYSLEVHLGRSKVYLDTELAPQLSPVCNWGGLIIDLFGYDSCHLYCSQGDRIFTGTDIDNYPCVIKVHSKFAFLILPLSLITETKNFYLLIHILKRHKFKIKILFSYNIWFYSQSFVGLVNGWLLVEKEGFVYKHNSNRL